MSEPLWRWPALCEALNLPVTEGPDVTGISIDSRSIQPGDLYIALTGDPEGVKYGGILSPLLRALEISCLPDQIPESFEVDCSSLNIGDTIHVSDISVPEGIRIRTDPSIAVATISAPEAEEVEEPEEEEVEEAPAEEEESPQED